jgi:Lar family restriction alleviation protein
MSCPFCGEFKQEVMVDDEGEHYIVCHSCGASGPFAETTSAARRLWQDRV